MSGRWLRVLSLVGLLAAAVLVPAEGAGADVPSPAKIAVTVSSSPIAAGANLTVKATAVDSSGRTITSYRCERHLVRPIRWSRPQCAGGLRGRREHHHRPGVRRLQERHNHCLQRRRLGHQPSVQRVRAARPHRVRHRRRPPRRINFHGYSDRHGQPQSEGCQLQRNCDLERPFWIARPAPGRRTSWVGSARPPMRALPIRPTATRSACRVAARPERALRSTFTATPPISPSAARAIIPRTPRFP